jgi:hypothetical protein
MPITKNEWRTEAISGCVRVVAGSGRSRIILARCAPKQIPETETHANAALMALAPRLAITLVNIVSSGLIGGEDHPIDKCGCAFCGIRRLAAKAEALIK